MMRKKTTKHIKDASQDPLHQLSPEQAADLLDVASGIAGKENPNASSKPSLWDIMDAFDKVKTSDKDAQTISASQTIGNTLNGYGPGGYGTSTGSGSWGTISSGTYVTISQEDINNLIKEVADLKREIAEFKEEIRRRGYGFQERKDI